jgi:ribose transport system permease protein
LTEQKRNAPSAARRPLASRGGTTAVAAIRKLIHTRESGVFLALVIFTIVMLLSSRQFATEYNIGIILKQMSVVAVLAFGQTLVMIVGAFDLSQAAIAGLCAMVPALLWQGMGLDPTIAVILGLILGAAIGAFNGILAAYFRLHPIVMTLATGIAITGLTYFISGGKAVVRVPEQLQFLGGTELFFRVPTPVVVMFIVCAVMHLALTRTLFGRRVLQVGGNEAAAKGLGINIATIRIRVFAVSGFLAALGGIMTIGRIGNASPEIGQSLLFPVVTAAIVGGTLLSGGVGTMLGTLMGAAIMAMVTNAIVLLRVNIYLTDTVQGVLVLIALLVDQFRRGEITVRKLLGRE